MNLRWLVGLISNGEGEAETEKKPPTQTRAPKALIVEHDKAAVERLEMILRNLGWDVEIERWAEDALDTLKSEFFDVAFVDLDFGGGRISGMKFVTDLRLEEMARQRRKHRPTIHMPVVFVTGADKVAIAAMPETTFVMIVKPATFETVTAALKLCNGLQEHPKPTPPLKKPWRISASVAFWMLVFYALGKGWVDKLIEQLEHLLK